MGLIADVVGFPVLGPLKAVVWIARQVAEQVERELYDEDTVRGQLHTLALRYDLGEISEEDYLQAEAVLLARLQEIREYMKRGEGA